MRLALSLVLLHVNAAPLASDGFAATTGRPPASELPRGVARAPIKSDEAKSTAKDYTCTGLAVETGPLRRPFRLWMHGEPGLVNAARAATYDVVLCIEIARERTARPQNTFWMPLYNFPPKRAPANATALSKRPVDMLYQSSNCDSRREQFAGTVRQIFEAEGLRFEHSGKCSAGSSRPRYQVPAAAPGAQIRSR